jgi:hypothetical protein
MPLLIFVRTRLTMRLTRVAVIGLTISTNDTAKNIPTSMISSEGAFRVVTNSIVSFLVLLYAALRVAVNYLYPHVLCLRIIQTAM